MVLKPNRASIIMKKRYALFLYGPGSFGVIQVHAQKRVEKGSPWKIYIRQSKRYGRLFLYYFMVQPFY
jgi:hypothetical protein